MICSFLYCFLYSHSSAKYLHSGSSDEENEKAKHKEAAEKMFVSEVCVSVCVCICESLCDIRGVLSRY